MLSARLSMGMPNWVIPYSGGKMATYPTTPKPLYVYSQSIQFFTMESAEDMGIFFNQRRAKYPVTGRNIWSLVYRYKDTGSDTLWDFYSARSGPWNRFTFVDPDPNGSGATYDARFIDPKMSRDLYSYLLYSSGLRIIEMIR